MIERSVLIQRPLFDVFDYLMDVERFWEWVPYFLQTEVVDYEKGWPSRFRARVGWTWDISYDTEVAISDLRQGRSISYSAGEPYPQVATYTVDPTPSGTIVTARHNPWAIFGSTALQGFIDVFGTDYVNQALANLKQALEARPPSSRPVVFLSYRRESAEYVAGRIVEMVLREFGATSVFRDLITIPAGGNPDAAIDAGLQSCFAVIVLIDKQWLQFFERKKEERSKDYVLLEIEAAIRHKKLIIPVTLEGVNTEDVQQGLPDKIEELRNKQWQQLRYDPDFTSDMHRILQAIWDEVMSRPPRRADPDETNSERPQRRLSAPSEPAWTGLLSRILRGWAEAGQIVWRTVQEGTGGNMYDTPDNR